MDQQAPNKLIASKNDFSSSYFDHLNIKEQILLSCPYAFLITLLWILSNLWGGRDGAVVRAHTSHQCGPDSILGLGVICGLSLLLVLVPAPRVFLRVLRFSSIHKKQHFRIPIQSGKSGEKSYSIRSTEIPIYFIFLFEYKKIHFG